MEERDGLEVWASLDGGGKTTGEPVSEVFRPLFLQVRRDWIVGRNQREKTQAANGVSLRSHRKKGTGTETAEMKPALWTMGRCSRFLPYKPEKGKGRCLASQWIRRLQAGVIVERQPTMRTVSDKRGTRGTTF